MITGACAHIEAVNSIKRPSRLECEECVKIGSEWWIYFDHYSRPQHYGAMRTNDWKRFEDMTDQVSFPEGHRHGTVVKIGEQLTRQLQEAHRP